MPVRTCITGVISEPRGANNVETQTPGLLSFVSTVWDDLRYTKSLTGIDFQFVRVDRRDEMTLDTLIEGQDTQSLES